MSFPKILLVDAYDSYSNNIVALVEGALDAVVTVIRIDDARLTKNRHVFQSFVQRFDAVIAGPGPGHPADETDVGLMKQLWSMEPPVPVLGVCLGFQSLALEYGARVERLKEPKHGMQSRVVHSATSIFARAGDVEATFYNSLHVDLGRRLCSSRWTPTLQCPQLVPLAWVEDDGDNGEVCVAVRHSSKPFWGVQYHPESICTNDQGARVFADWWEEAARWLQRQANKPPTPRSMSASSPTRSSLEAQREETSDSARKVQWKSISLDDWQTTLGDIHQSLSMKQHVVLLESGTTGVRGDPVRPETGRFSILSCTDLDKTDRFEYRVKLNSLRHIREEVFKDTDCHVDELWHHLQSFVDNHKATDGPEQVPFWGGLVGFISYEACLATIDIRPDGITSQRPDSCFVFVDRSVVVDHVDKQIYIQSVRGQDESWVEDICLELGHRVKSSGDKMKSSLFGLERDSIFKSDMATSTSSGHQHKGTVQFDKPQEAIYCDKVDECKERIRQGHSYELCLTDQTTITMEGSSTPFHTARDLYQKLRRHNPAPFGALMSLPCGTETLQLLSSSPERFLSWSRRTGTCQFRPIKGTVRKSPGLTRAMAHAALAVPKERAENLMIVDLIRHDLCGVLGPRSVSVPKLMVVEEYASVYQLVSVIEGDLDRSGKRGIDVLAASLPPGSMTGAPKRRSCQLLQGLEAHRPRGLYAGVLGYLDVGGGGDFCVVIRSAVSWAAASGGDAASMGQSNAAGESNAAVETASKQVWTIGAGGAVTVASSAAGEWAEMQDKRDALLGIFSSSSA